MPGGNRRTANETILLHLAGGASIEGAAQLAGVSARTVARRLADSGFRHQLAEARAEMISRGLGHLSKGAAEAGITLRRLLRCDSPKVRLGAARALLSLLVRVQMLTDHESRLLALEGERAPRLAGARA